MKRIGIIGYGFIGRALFEAIAAEAHPGLTVAFVWNRSRGRLSGVPLALLLDNLAEAPARGADLVVEAAHPEITRAHGAAILGKADYMPLSVTALADDALRQALLDAAAASGHRLLLPQGALVGAD